jgi:hypothetical protein
MNFINLLLDAEVIHAKTTQDLANTAEQLGRATNELGVYNMITGTFLTIVLIFTVLQIYTSYKLTSKLSIISEASIKTMEFFNNKMLKEINIDQARSEISEQLDKMSSSMKFQIILMKELNHIANEEETMRRIDMFIKNMHNKAYNHFKKFEYKEKLLTEVLEPNFTDSAAELMKRLLYLKGDEFNATYINSQVEDFHSQVKTAFNIRLDDF